MATKKKVQLRAVRIQVRDVLGAREFSIEPGKVNILSGANGTGKSSALRALETALGGGNLARLARIDPGGKETEPEVVLVLAATDGSEAYRVEKKGDKLKVKARVGDSAGFEDVAKPQAWLKSLYDSTGANPVAFLTAKIDERATMLLEAIPLEYDRDKLVAAMGVETGVTVPKGVLHPLQDIALVREDLYNRRTGVNRDQKTKAAAALEVRQAAPVSAPEGLNQRLADLRASIDVEAEACAKLQADAINARAAALKAALVLHERDTGALARGTDDTCAKLKAAHAEQAREIRAAAEKRIEELRQQMDVAIDAAKTRLNEALAAADAEKSAADTAAEATFTKESSGLSERQHKLAEMREEAARLQEQTRAAAKAAGLIEQALRFEKEAEDLARDGEELTEAIEAVDQFRRDLAQNLPIPGLEIEGKEVKVNGVPFDMLNTEQRVTLAVRVACLRAKGAKLPVVFVDGAEALDREHFEALVARLEEEQVQAFLARVSEEPLKVETRGLFDGVE